MPGVSTKQTDEGWWRWIAERVGPPLLAAIVFVICWSVALRVWQLPALLLPSPSAVAQRLWSDRLPLLIAWWLTARAALMGLTLSLLGGSLVAIIFSQFRWIRYALYPYAIFLQTVPIVAIAPLLVMWFGYGQQGVVAVAFVLSLFPMIASVTAGMMSPPAPLVELFGLYRASRWQRVLKLQFPFAMPYLATGLKTSSGLAVIGAIVGEFFVGAGDEEQGLGHLIRSAADRYQTDRLFAAITLSTLLGVSVFAMISMLAERVLRRFGPV